MGVNGAGRLLIVSNRLPATARIERGGVRLVESVGGLATGMRPAHERMNGIWFGWPGNARPLAARQRASVDRELAKKRYEPIHLTAKEVKRFYHGFSNGVLWPVFHYALERLPLEARDWLEYQRVNERFADAVARAHRPGDLVWVHDYQLALVPALLRERVPKARIAFFLHVPFPASEVFHILPWREELLRGILGADLVGFHTLAYLRHFASSALRILGLETRIDRLWHEDREVRLAVHPMGVDVSAFEAAAAAPEVLEEALSIRRQAGQAAIVLGVDRLDYSKGIPRRMNAFERLLEREPHLRKRVRFIQVAAPSRAEVRAYAEFERRVDELVGRINGRYGTADWAPIHYVHQAVPQRRVVALYLAADVLLVTPLRDGLNLVAKEYAAARTDLGGSIVLSEFAGVASEMPEAISVNPYDVEGMASAMTQALLMPREERARRMRAIRKRLVENDVRRWCDTFLDELRSATASSAAPPRKLVGAAARSAAGRCLSAPRLALFLDYDGTLVPLEPHPDLAAPDAPLLELLRALGERPATSVHVVSGRDAGTMERWLGALPLALHAEHGLWSRGLGEREWSRNAVAPDGWKEKIRPVLEAFTRATPRTFVEEKTGGLVWHYARAEREHGPRQALELRLHLLDVLSNAPVQVVTGDHVVEIRPQGIDKGALVSRVLERAGEPAPLAVAIGDDVTDEELFRAVPEGGLAIHVGPSRSVARWRLPDTDSVRAFLRQLLEPREAPRARRPRAVRR